MAGILAAGFAPAAIGSGVLMPVRKIIVPAPLLPPSLTITVSPGSCLMVGDTIMLMDGRGRVPYTVTRSVVTNIGGWLSLDVDAQVIRHSSYPDPVALHAV